MAAATERVEAHQASEVSAHQQSLRDLHGTLGVSVRGRLVDDDYAGEEKVVYFIRHGEGFHNVAQREWRAAKKDSEPYTVANDPGFGYVDAELTDVGVGQAKALRPRFAAMAVAPELVVVSPMRRATQTALLAIGDLAPRPRVLANEDCHETGGRHTCDKRLSRSELRAHFPDVDYGDLAAEDDPLWDAEARESATGIAARAARFATWLEGRPERRVVVAAHSGFLLAFFNAVLTTDTDEARSWFGTGECRCLALAWDSHLLPSSG